MTLGLFYILDENKKAVECDLDSWRKFYESGGRIIKQEEHKNYYVSTIFLGAIHGFNDKDESILFETMIRDKSNGEWIYQDRYSTYDEALEGHKKALQWVDDGCKEDSE